MLIHASITLTILKFDSLRKYLIFLMCVLCEKEMELLNILFLRGLGFYISNATMVLVRVWKFRTQMLPWF